MKELIFSMTLEAEPLSPINMYKVRILRKYGKLIPMMYLDARFTSYKKAFTKAVKKIVKRDKIKPYPGAVAVEADLYFGTLRRKDIQNALKLELDALNGLIYDDDSQVCSVNTQKHFNKDRPRIEIKIYKYPEADFPINTESN